MPVTDPLIFMLAPSPMVDRSVRESFDGIQRLLIDWYASLSYGPLPGGYVSFELSTHDPAGLAAVAPVDAQALWGQMRPIFLSAWCDDGTITATVRDSAGDLKAISVTSTPTGYKNREDFLKDNLKDALYLDLDSVDSGTPTRLKVFLVCKNVQQVEPV